MNSAQRRKRQRTAQPTTQKELAQLGRDIREAEAAEHEQALREARLRRQHDHDRRVVARTEPKIKALEPELAAKRKVVAKLEEERAELVAKIEATATPSPHDVRDVDDIEQALIQAVRTGAELISGVSVAEGGGLTPMHQRVPHPRLIEAAPDLDWTYSVEALERALNDLKAERDDAAQRLRRNAA